MPSNATVQPVDLATYHPICDAVALLLRPHAEVVLHSLETETVAYLVNPFSRREIGEPSLLHEIDFQACDRLIGPYEKLNWDGRRLKSVSAVLRGAGGRAIGVLCINLDVTHLQSAIDLLTALAKAPADAQNTAVLFKEDWHERINEYVHGWTVRHGVRVADMNRMQKRRLVLELSKDGAFGGKHAAAYISRVLQMGRATVYNYLRASREEEERQDVEV